MGFYSRSEPLSAGVDGGPSTKQTADFSEKLDGVMSVRTNRAVDGHRSAIYILSPTLLLLFALIRPFGATLEISSGLHSASLASRILQICCALYIKVHRAAAVSCQDATK